MAFGAPSHVCTKWHWFFTPKFKVELETERLKFGGGGLASRDISGS